MPAGVAAGHPATMEIGLGVLAMGGSAADAAAAAALASCVAESILTGIGGGGFATYFDAGTGEVTCLDFFCSVPGSDGDRSAGPMVPIEVAFGGVPLAYSIGGASVAVPGVPAGVAEVHRRWGRLPWERVVEPAIALARSGVALPHEQARTLASVKAALVPGAGAEIYQPNGRLLTGGDLLFHPGLDVALQALADEGPDVFYTGHVADAMVDSVRAGDGALGPADLAGYRVLEVPAAHAPLDGYHVFGRHDLAGLIETIGTLPPSIADLPRGERAVALADALRGYGRQKVGDTTNISVVDSDGDACVVTTTLGIGSGVWLEGLGVHMNSMLGEGELITGALVPGQRMASMMCPLVVLDERGELVLAAGSAGASRIRSALVHTLVNVLLDGLTVRDAVYRARFHVADDVVHAEPGCPEDELEAVAKAGYRVNRWDHVSHYFGGVSAVGHAGAAGDPRRGGAGQLLTT